MPDATVEPQRVLTKIIRSALTIITYVLLGPFLALISYDLLFNFAWIAHAPKLYGALGILPGTRLIIFYLGGFVHTLLAGCMAALLSPSIARNTIYIAASFSIGAVIALIFPLPGPHIFYAEFWSQAGPKLVACFGLGSVLCAVLTLPFRAKPDPTP